MHSYLRAVGFSNVKSRHELEEVLAHTQNNPDKKQVVSVNKDDCFCEITKFYGNGIGIRIVGFYDENDEFCMDHYFPIIMGETPGLFEEVSITKKSGNMSFSVMCDDVRLGVILIFYLQNSVEFLKLIEEPEDYVGHRSAILSGLSVDGKIILPVDKTPQEANQLKLDRNKRSKLITDARNGDEEAIESLTMEDIDTFAQISRRVRSEDLYSIVDTSFYPYGAEADIYSIIGNILDYDKVKNEMTGEEVYVMLVESNDVLITVGINEKDLYGIPMIGARFKGSVWMQGNVAFS